MITQIPDQYVEVFKQYAKKHGLRQRDVAEHIWRLGLTRLFEMGFAVGGEENGKLDIKIAGKSKGPIMDKRVLKRHAIKAAEHGMQTLEAWFQRQIDLKPEVAEAIEDIREEIIPYAERADRDKARIAIQNHPKDPE